MEQTMNGLVFSVNELNLMLAPGQVVDGYIEVRQPLGQAFEGVVRASGVGMECSEARIGSRTGMFPWRFDAAGFEDVTGAKPESGTAISLLTLCQRELGPVIACLEGVIDIGPIR